MLLPGIAPFRIETSDGGEACAPQFACAELSLMRRIFTML
jgi:hypothetical protein